MPAPTTTAVSLSATGTLPTTPKCQSKYGTINGISYTFPRYGMFRRTDIVPTTTTYELDVSPNAADTNGWICLSQAVSLANIRLLM